MKDLVGILVLVLIVFVLIRHFTTRRRVVSYLDRLTEMLNGRRVGREIFARLAAADVKVTLYDLQHGHATQGGPLPARLEFLVTLSENGVTDGRRLESPKEDDSHWPPPESKLLIDRNNLQAIRTSADRLEFRVEPFCMDARYLTHEFRADLTRLCELYQAGIPMG